MKKEIKYLKEKIITLEHYIKCNKDEVKKSKTKGMKHHEETLIEFIKSQKKDLKVLKSILEFITTNTKDK